MVGQTLAHYTILAKIGSGGMGEVYLAEDQTLSRRVALKVLPRELGSEDRRARFAREARNLAALNHPNIVTVHSVEEAEGIPFITMELVEGKTLAELLPRGGWPLDRFFDISIPIADAVAAAHQHGIVHRDLKPGNVMMTVDGRVKVLDFGLAKPFAGLGAADAAGEVPTATMTEPGVIVGTWSYMSPEQARGQPVDARSDIFALGVVFYEMLTGRRPFGGDTPTEVLSSILRDAPPPVSSLRAGIPREVSRIVQRCLAKDTSRRTQSALDVRNELEEVKREIDSGELVADPRPAATRPLGTVNVRWAIASAIGVLALGGVVAWMWMAPNETRVIHLSSPRQVTFTAGVEMDPTFSPDGGRIAYVSDQSGNEDIWVSPGAGGAAVNFTADHAGRDFGPAWSPDGNQIAFVSERDGGGVFIMSAIGGRPLRIASQASAEVVAFPQWSADGTELAHIRREQFGNVIEIVSVATRESRRLRVPGDSGNRHDLSWSPDGRFFAYIRAASREQEVTRLWVLRASDGEAFPLTDGTTGDWSPEWSTDGRTIFYVSNRGGGPDLWQQRLTAGGTPAGDPSPVTVGVGMRDAVFSPDGRKLAYSRGRPVANVWRVPIVPDREAGWGDAEQLTFDEAHVTTMELLPDGERLIISSDRGGGVDLWMTTVGGRDMVQLTTDRGPDQAPHVSPDGQHIAFHSYRRGNYDIWVLPLDGGPAHQVTTDPRSEMYPAWSPDGGQLAFYAQRDNATNVFVMPAAGGEIRQVTKGPVSKYYPQWSPDGQWIFYASEGPNGRQIYRLPAAGGQEEQITKGPAFNFRWSPDRTRIYFPGIMTRGNTDLWALTLADRQERQLTRFSGKSGSVGASALAVGKTHLYFTWRHDVGDIWVIDVAADSER